MKKLLTRGRDFGILVKKGARRLRKLSRPSVPPEELCTVQEAGVLLSLAYGRPFSDEACRIQTNYRRQSVLAFALKSNDHLRSIAPDFVDNSGANTQAESLTFDGTGVNLAISLVTGQDFSGVDERAGFSWARAYELFWTAVFSALSDQEISKLLGGHAEPVLSQLRGAIDSCAQVDRLVEEGDIDSAFIKSRQYLADGLGTISSRYAALTVVLGGSAFETDHVLGELSGRLPPGFIFCLQSMMQQRSVSSVSGSPLSVAGFLPESYAKLAVANDSTAQFSADSKSAWSLLARETISIRPEVPSASVFSDAKSHADKTTGSDRDDDRIAASTLASSLQRVIEAIPAGAVAEAPVFLLSSAIDIPDRMRNLAGRFVEQGECVPVFQHIIGRHSATHWQAGDWVQDARFCGLLVGSAAYATTLRSTLDEDVLTSILEEARDPVIVYTVADQELVETPGELEALVISEESLDSESHVHIGADASCESALSAIDAYSGARELNADSSVVVLSPGLVYPEGYVGSVTAAHAQGGRRASVAACDVFVDKEVRFRVGRVGSNDAVVRTSLVALGCWSLSDVRQSLQMQPGSRFYESIAFPVLPAVPMRHRIDVVGANEPALIKLQRRIDSNVAAAQVFERSRRPLVGWITQDGNQLVPVVRGYNAISKRFWTAQSVISTFVQDPLDRSLSGKVHHGISAGWLDLLFDEHEERLLRAFLQRAFSEREFLRECSVNIFSRIAEIARRLGLQTEYAEVLLPNVLPLAVSAPQLTIEMFGFLVGAVDEARFYALLIGASSVCFNRKDGSDRSAHRLIEVVARYCSPQMIELFLSVTSVSRKAKLLTEPEVKRKLGTALHLSGAASFDAFAALGTTADNVGGGVQVKDRLTLALGAGAERAEVVALLRQFIEEGGDLIDLADLVRPYSSELASYRITSEDWPYPFHGTADAVLALAALLSDKEQIARTRPDVGNAEIVAMARTRGGEPDALDQYFWSLAEPFDITALKFRGDSIEALFKFLEEQPSTRPVVTGGPLVSVIMTAWNPDLELIRLAIQSVLNQSYSNFELLVIDDGSETGFETELNGFFDNESRIRYIRLDKNAGPYVGRNIALERASGEFVAIQDADDYSHPDRFALQVEQFVNFPSLMACASRHLRFDRDGQLQLEHDFQLRGDGTMSSMFRKTAFDLTGPFAAVRSRGDVEFRERVKKAFGPQGYRQIGCPLVFCFSAPGTLSHSTKREKNQQLQAFRRAFRAREWRLSPTGPVPLGELAVPWALRP